MEPGAQIVNQNVLLDDLKRGLTLLQNYQEPTMYICPEATLLDIENNGTLMQTMLQQSSDMQTSISIFDVIGGNDPDPLLYMNDIITFRNSTGSNGLMYGTAYYPFLGTTIMQPTDIDYTNLFGGDIEQLEVILNPSGSNPALTAIFQNIKNDPKGLSASQNQTALLNASQDYTQIMAHVLSQANILPPSGGMAGIITTTDNNSGPWMAPANTSIVGVSSLPIRLTDSQQGALNTDDVSGKSINAFRFFNGLGILVWGARTLDGNSMDWKYLPVCRTMIYLKQSCMWIASKYTFAPNTSPTWNTVKADIENFLNGVWKAGGLMGAKASDAYSVTCGLGSTMTSDDMLNGFMNVIVTVAITNPAEFVVIEFQQQMATE
ncbi:phage tail sheath family protein [Flavobacterium sp. 3HN19-14]|uniref:phage tail sheath family protein n=1 Tax=Flavobacterium sp. 3HN19-14 TaxID=3448133 RepID=UPI003EE193D3